VRCHRLGRKPVPDGAALGGSPHHLSWARVEVGGRPAVYGTAGSGTPVLFLHGWGTGAHAYKRPLQRLARRGCQVYAPALPGFGGTADLPADKRTIHGYATWLAAFLDAVGVDGPAFVVGHSFGGAVATVLAHDHPGRVRYLVLLNAVGGATRATDPSTGHLLADRPLWDWGWHFGKELFPPSRGLRIMGSLWEDLIPNLLRNPRAFWDIGNLARRADLTDELADLRRLGLPVLAWQGDRDGVIPLASFEALCRAIGTEGRVVAGNHSWLLTNPDAFDEVMANVLELAGTAASQPAHITPPLRKVSARRRGGKRG
jgi:pimeloyl-ACP methyl ester carboxylesterase